MSSYYDLEGELKNIINESKAVRNDMSDMRRHQKFMDQSIEEKTTAEFAAIPTPTVPFLQ